MQVKNGVAVVPFKHKNGRWQIFLQTRNNNPDKGKLEIPCETIEYGETELDAMARCLLEEVNPAIDWYQLYGLNGEKLVKQIFYADPDLPASLMITPLHRLNTIRNGVSLFGTCVMAELAPNCEAVPHNEATNPAWIDVLQVERMAKQNPQKFTYTIGAILIACAALKRKPLNFSI